MIQTSLQTTRAQLAVSALLFSIPVVSHAAPVAAVATGPWTTAATWSDAAPAAAGNTYTIDGFTVTSPTGSNAVAFPGDAITLSKTGAAAGVLDLARLHAATLQNVATNLPPITINDGATLQFRASTGSNAWNIAVGCDITTSGTVLINNTGGGFDQDINFSGTLAGSGLINYQTSNSGSSANTQRNLTLNSADSTYSGNWSVTGAASGDDFGVLSAGAAKALGTGSVTVNTRARLHSNAEGGLDSLSGVTLNSPSSYLVLNNRNWTNPAAVLTGNAGFADLGSATVSIGSLALGTAQVLLTVGGASDGKIITAGDADFGTLASSLLVNVAENPEGKTFDLVTYGGTLVNPPQVSLPPVGRLTPVVSNGGGTNDKVTLGFTGSTADLVWKGNDGTSPNAWNLNSTANFDNGGSPDVFIAWDDVLFDGTASSFTPEITGNLVAGTVTFGGATDYTLSGTGSISGSSSLVKTGSSTATILNANSFTGTATVSGGNLRIGNGGTTGDLGAVTVDVQSPGTLSYLRSENGLNVATAFSGNGTVAFMGTGAANQSAYNFTGDSSGFTGTIRADDARLNVNSQTDAGSALIQIQEGGQLYLQAGTLENDVEIAGTGWSETAGLLGALRFSTNTDITGTVTLTGDARMGSHNNAFTFTGTLAESGGAHTLDIRNTSGGNDPVYTFSGTSTRTGPTTVSGNRLRIFDSAALGSGPVTVQSNGSNGSITRLQPEGVTLSNDITLASTAETEFRGALHASGNSVSTINGDVTATASVSNGGDIAAEGGTDSVLRLMGELNVGGSKTGISQRIGTVEYGGGASTAYSLNVGGTARLAAGNGIGPDVKVALGFSGEANSTLDLNGFNTTIAGLSRSSNVAVFVTNQGAADATLTISSADNSTFPGSVVDGAIHGIGIVKGGSSTLLLTGSNTYSGTTTVAGGVLGGSGSINSDTTVQSGATLAPGAGIGTLGTRDVTFAAGSTFSAELNSTVPSLDLLNAFGDVTIGTGVSLDLADIAGSPAALPLGTRLELINYTGGTLTGTFDGLPEGGEIAAGQNTFSIAYDDNDFVVLTVVASSDPYAAWANANGIPGEAFDVDSDGDGVDNGLEWILGGDPDAQDASSLVTTTGNGTNGLTLVFSRSAETIGAATLSVEWDSDLDAFANSLVIGTADVGPNGNLPTIDIDAPGAGQVTVNIPAANAVGGKLFARIRATRP